MRVFTLTLLVCVAAGCDRVKTRQIVDAGPVCGENEHLINGTCRYVCNRDGDCQTGERCNLLFGACEPKPPPVDAGPQLLPCTEGAVRCSADATALQSCSDAGVFEVAEVCPQPDGYCENEQCRACRPGTRRCGADTTTAELCLDNGSGWRTITCAATASCTAGECQECAVGDRRCNAANTNVEACERTSDETRATAYTGAGDNFDGTCITQQCEAGPTGPQCHPPTCIPGAQGCASGTVQQICGPTGSWAQNDCLVTLNSSTAQCVSGNCIDECADAAAAKSYFGCEYWTTVMDNVVVPQAFMGGVLDGGQGTQDSEFAFVVANNSTQPTTFNVLRWFNNAEQTVKSVTIPGKNDAATRGVVTVKVPWQTLRKSTQNDSLGVSGRAKYAYHLKASRPVTVYQFNPLGAFANYGSCSVDTQCTLGSNSTCQNGTCRYLAYSNDASLLLPAHILGTSYVGLVPEGVINRGSASNSGAPRQAFNGTLTVIATDDATTVTVTPSAVTLAGTGVAALDAGTTNTFTLAKYEILQLSNALPPNIGSTTAGNLECTASPYNASSSECSQLSTYCSFLGQYCAEYQYYCVNPGPQNTCRVANNDLTGSIISADKPIAVFGGSACTLRGYSDSACDHVEEQLFPFVTWGKNFVAGRTAPLRLATVDATGAVTGYSTTFASTANAGPDYYKIVAGCPTSDCPNGTTVNLSSTGAINAVLTGGGCEPGTALTNAAAPCRLRGGRYVEFRSKASFTISADQPIQVAQFFAGQNATGGTTPTYEGDPSQILLPPVEQWRANYTVLTAPGILDNYLGIVVDDAKVQEVRVDGTAVTAGWTAISGTTFKVSNVAVSVGSHTVQVIARPGQQQLPGAGVTVYGFDSYVSYGYTGGLDLQALVTGVNPGG